MSTFGLYHEMEVTRQCPETFKVHSLLFRGRNHVYTPRGEVILEHGGPKAEYARRWLRELEDGAS